MPSGKLQIHPRILALTILLFSVQEMGTFSMKITRLYSMMLIYTSLSPEEGKENIPQ